MNPEEIEEFSFAHFNVAYPATLYDPPRLPVIGRVWNVKPLQGGEPSRLVMLPNLAGD